MNSENLFFEVERGLFSESNSDDETIKEATLEMLDDTDDEGEHPKKFDHRKKAHISLRDKKAAVKRWTETLETSGERRSLSSVRK
uniref:Uncharacterized protein n=1 Tax=Acrobeloides nanus TaxID=290746 RepID=A0A914DGK3_9BILA